MDPPASSSSHILDQISLIESPSDHIDLVGVIESGAKKSKKPENLGVNGENDDDDVQFDTLDEPVWETMKRDLIAVGMKFKYVVQPGQSQMLLKDWDLWGPLFLCVLTALLLQESGNERGPQFTEVFVITWFGTCVVTLNTKLLGGNISFFQSLCVLGYCLAPCVCALIICKLLITLTPAQSVPMFILRLGVTVCGFLWSTYAATGFLTGCHVARRKALAVYPIFLFYFLISWLIITQTHYGH